MIYIGARSYKLLEGVHPDLKAVVLNCANFSTLEFIVTEGVRTHMRQAELVRAGASRTMRSRHLTGHAVDLAVMLDGDVRWDWPLYHTLAKEMKAAAKRCGVPIEWGGDWKEFPDGPHFQLPWGEYPIEPDQRTSQTA